VENTLTVHGVVDRQAMTLPCVMQYAVSEAVAKESVDADAFVDAARTHGFGMWKLDCR